MNVLNLNPLKKNFLKLGKSFCETHPRKAKEARLTEFGSIHQITTSEGTFRTYISDKTLLPNIRYAEAMLALCQLIQLRDCYNDGWIPDWSIHTLRSCIGVYKNKVVPLTCSLNSKILVFKTAGLRDEFLNNFGDLLETAKLLL